MILYQRKTLSTDANLGDPGSIPAALLGWDDASLADVSAAAPDAAIELGFDGQGFFPVVIPDPIPPPEPAQPLQKIDFMRLFTAEERKAVRRAAKVNEDIEDYQNLLDLSTVILLTDPSVQAGIPMLEYAGLIGPGRAAQILANEAP